MKRNVLVCRAHRTLMIGQKISSTCWQDMYWVWINTWKLIVRHSRSWVLAISTTCGRLLYSYDLLGLDSAIATHLLLAYALIFGRDDLWRWHNLILDIAAVCNYTFLPTCVTLISALRSATWLNRAMLARLPRKLLTYRLIVYELRSNVLVVQLNRWSCSILIIFRRLGLAGSCLYSWKNVS